MKLKEFLEKVDFQIINMGNDTDIDVTKVFCCDLLSVAMAKNPAGSVWVTVMGNVNTVAVNVLTEGACIIFAEGIAPDEMAANKAASQGVTMLKTELPVFEAALAAHKIIQGE